MNEEYIGGQMIGYFQQELKWAHLLITSNAGEPWEIKQQTLQRMLGCANFCQNLGVDYNFIESCYNKYKDKVEQL